MMHRRSPAATVWRALLMGLMAVTVAWPQNAAPKEKPIFEGLVRDSVTKLPIAKASIHIIPIAPNQAGYAGVTDAAGSFRFEAIPPGDYRIGIRSRGYAEAQASIAPSGTEQFHPTLHRGAEREWRTH